MYSNLCSQAEKIKKYKSTYDQHANWIINSFALSFLFSYYLLVQLFVLSHLPFYIFSFLGGKHVIYGFN